MRKGASLGNFPIFPQTGCVGDDVNGCVFTKTLRASRRINETVEAHPGYFAVSLNTSVHAEMTVSNHTALYRFTFPPRANLTGLNSTAPGIPDLPYSPLILADLTDLSDSRSNASIAVDPSSGRIVGNGTFTPSFGIGTYDLHFCADFKGAAIRDTGVFMNNRAGNEPKSLHVYSTGTDSPPIPAGAWVQFHPPKSDQLLVRVGLSFISTEKACQNAEREIGGFDFGSTVSSAKDAWKAKLGVVQLDQTSVNTTFLTTFWSGTYRSMISPQDYTGTDCVSALRLRFYRLHVVLIQH